MVDQVNEDEYNEEWTPVFNVYKRKLNKALQISAQFTSFPPREKVFRIFKEMPLSSIKVVMLGQDPYIKEGQATGFAYDCTRNKPQPSLRNIFKEIQNEFPDRNYQFRSNSLERWVYEEGIFLLNTGLTVKENEPGSLLEYWYDFTDAIIQYISMYNTECIFLLMGKPAESKSRFITDKSRIVTSVHPSPLSAYRGFFDSDTFVKIEKKLGHEINWESGEKH